MSPCMTSKRIAMKRNASAGNRWLNNGLHSRKPWMSPVCFKKIFIPLLFPVCSEVWSLHSCLDIDLPGERIGLAVHWHLTSTAKAFPLTEVGVCAYVCVCVRHYRRSFLLRRKSFLVCAISASLGRGEKTCRVQITGETEKDHFVESIHTAHETVAKVLFQTSTEPHSLVLWFVFNTTRKEIKRSGSSNPWRWLGLIRITIHISELFLYYFNWLFVYKCQKIKT